LNHLCSCSDRRRGADDSPSVVIERRLADAGIDAAVDTIVRFV
jgi:hypothetical protein